MGTTFSTPKDTNCWALVDIVTGSSYIGKDKDGNAVPVMLFPQAYLGSGQNSKPFSRHCRSKYSLCTRSGKSN